MSRGEELWQMVAVFAPLSLLSIGGGQAAIPDVQHQAVVVHHWLTDPQFAQLFALSRVAPGPSSTLLVSLIGWYRDGLAGALVAGLAIFGPSSLLAYATSYIYYQQRESKALRVLTRALSPIAVGLVFAGALTVMRANPGTLLTLLTPWAVCVAASYTRFGTLRIVAAVAGVFALFYYLGLSGG